jgi:hypothetical protein
MVQHVDPAKPSNRQTDPCGYAIAGILNEDDVFGGLRPVHFQSQKCSSAKQNYNIYYQALLAIGDNLNQWRHYLDGANYKVLIRCAHMHLEYFQTLRVIS